MTMPNHTAALSAIAIPAPAEPGGVPEWVQLVPKGRVHSYDGKRGPFWYDDASAVIEASFAGARRVHVDANHSTEKLAKLGGDAPAHGYVVEMEERPDGIWGRVDWNPSGIALMENRSYWGVSPVLAYDASGRVLRIKNVALTNDPALRELVALNSANMENGMDFLKKVAEMLGLSAEASEEDIMAALKKAMKPAEKTEAMTALAAVTDALGLKDGASQTELVAQVTALSAANEQIAALQAQVTELKGAGKERDASAWLQSHLSAGRAIPKGKEELYTALHMENPERAEEIVQTLPVLAETHLGGKPAPKGEKISDLSADQKNFAHQIGMTGEEFLAALQADAKAEETA